MQPTAGGPPLEAIAITPPDGGPAWPGPQAASALSAAAATPAAAAVVAATADPARGLCLALETLLSFLDGWATHDDVFAVPGLVELLAVLVVPRGGAGGTWPLFSFSFFFFFCVCVCVCFSVLFLLFLLSHCSCGLVFFFCFFCLFVCVTTRMIHLPRPFLSTKFVH
jgi:hypothetical protein